MARLTMAILTMHQLVELAEQLEQPAAPACEQADHAEARVVAQPPEQHGEVGMRAGAGGVAQVLARPNRLVEDVRLVQVASVALAQVELVVELSNAAGYFADLPRVRARP